MQARVHARDQRLLQPCVRAWHELTTPCANIRGPRIPLHKCACARRFTHLVARVNSYVARNLVALLDFFFPLSFLFFFFLFFFCFDFFPLFSWFISFSTSFYLFSMFTSLFFLRCGISSFFFILPLSFCHPFLSLFIFVAPSFSF